MVRNFKRGALQRFQEAVQLSLHTVQHSILYSKAFFTAVFPRNRSLQGEQGGGVCRAKEVSDWASSVRCSGSWHTASIKEEPQ